MSYTGAELLQGFSQFISDWFTSETTATGTASGTTLVDDALKQYTSKRLAGRFVRITSAGDNQYLYRPIANNDGSTGVVEFMYPFPAQITSGTTYEIHKYEPADKFKALDEARFDAADSVYQLLYDETITADGRTDTFTIPHNMVLGPVTVWEERPIAANNLLWNFVNTPLGDSTNYWTPSSGVTPTIVQTNYQDLIIPKYDYGSTVLAIDANTAGTYSQTVSNMAQSMTATAAAGRQMAFGMWVLCEQPSRVSIRIQDDSGYTDSEMHAGRGWQLLSVERTISASNATTLTVSLRITSGQALTIGWNRSWFYYGDKQRIINPYPIQTFPNIRRDAMTQTFTLPRFPVRGHQLRIVGMNWVSELGTDIFNQMTNQMELNGATSRIMYATAATILFEWQGITSADVPEVFQRIATIKRRGDRLQQFGQSVPIHNVSTPYWR